MTAIDTGSLLRRIVVIVAHQDDETACSVPLQRAREAQVVFATDGAPASEFFWGSYGSRDKYAAMRHAEALQALGVIGITGAIFLQDGDSGVPFHDQELYLSLPSATSALAELVGQFKPDALITPAYEGGHPDHDACSFLASAVGHSVSLPVWEMPLYHRSSNAALVHQKFLVPSEGEIVLYPTELELQRRDQMLSQYLSQPDVSKFVNAQVERFRPQPSYDYSQPPHQGPLNYEAWGWPMTGAKLCSAFQSCREHGLLSGSVPDLSCKPQAIS